MIAGFLPRHRLCRRAFAHPVHPCRIDQLTLQKMIARPPVRIVPIVSHSGIGQLESQRNHVGVDAAFRDIVTGQQHLREKAGKRRRRTVGLDPFVARLDESQRLSVVYRRCILQNTQQPHAVTVSVTAMPEIGDFGVPEVQEPTSFVFANQGRPVRLVILSLRPDVVRKFASQA